MWEQKTALILLLILAVVLFYFPEIVVEAEPKTIVVPDDYQTIVDAVGNASRGDTIYVKKGTYEEPINQTLVINKSISLIGENPENTILSLHPELVFQGYDSPMVPRYGYENSIGVQASDVELSGFTFKGEGIFFDMGHNNQIINNVIKLHLWLDGSNCNATLNSMVSVNVGGIENTVKKNSLTGAISVRFSSRNTICDNVVTNGSAIGLVGSSSNRVFNNTVKNCKIGVAIHLDSSDNAVYDNILLNNQIGFAIHVDGSNNAIYNNYVANSSCGINIGRYSKSGENTTLYHNNFVDNIIQVNTESRAEDYGLIFDNGKEGNYWSNYNGTDSNGDGIGDISYVIDENKRDNFPLMEPVEMLAIPEFSSLLILPLFLIATLAVIVGRKKLSKIKERE